MVSLFIKKSILITGNDVVSITHVNEFYEFGVKLFKTQVHFNRVVLLNR